MESLSGQGRSRGRGRSRGLKGIHHAENVDPIQNNETTKVCAGQFEDVKLMHKTTCLDKSQTQHDIKSSAPPKKATVNINQKYVKVLAKYTYKANPDSPGGFSELSLKSGEHYNLLSENLQQPHWWLLENSNKEKGYAPSSYLMKVEAKIPTLPWLANKEMDNTVLKPIEEQSGFKKYSSAYNNKDKVTQKSDARLQGESDSWRCDVCAKTLNGPIPYRMHMKSKAHKEEMELAELYGRA